MTHGHLDLIARGSRIFDHLVVAVLQNSAKHPLFSVPERVEMLTESVAGLGNVSIATFDGLLVDFARQHYVAAVTTYYSVTGSFTPPGQAWILSQGAVSRAGVVVPMGWGSLYTALPASCQRILSAAPTTGKGDASGNAVFSCMQAHGWRGFVSYQPASRYWPFQGIETGIYVLLAAALIAVTFAVVRRRDA